MTHKKDTRKQQAAPAAGSEHDEHDQRDSGMPGGGQGRRDVVERSGVYPPTADNIPPDAQVRAAGSWGGGDYNESGGSELVMRDGQVLGGLTSDADGRPTIDTHGADRPPTQQPSGSGDSASRDKRP